MWDMIVLIILEILSLINVAILFFDAYKFELYENFLDFLYFLVIIILGTILWVYDIICANKGLFIDLYNLFACKTYILTTKITLFTSFIYIITQVLFLVIITIWTRAAGPRFRLDQLLTLTWKDLFIYLCFNVILFIVLIIIV